MPASRLSRMFNIQYPAQMKEEPSAKEMPVMSSNLKLLSRPLPEITSIPMKLIISASKSFSLNLSLKNITLKMRRTIAHV